MSRIKQHKALEQGNNKLKEDVHSLKDERDHLLESLGDSKRGMLLKRYALYLF